MTVLILRRFVPEPRIKRRRFGPDNRVAALVQGQPDAPLPVVVAVGPGGPQGDDGIVANPADILDYIAIFDGSLT
jgi:hypothetical protein